MRNYYTWLAGTLLLAGCHKDAEVAPDLTGTYTASTTVRAAHPIAMYTKDGLVNNPTLMSRFLKRLVPSDYFSTTDQAVGTGLITQLAFRGGDRVTLLNTANGHRDSTLLHLTARPAGNLLLQATDTLRYFTSAPTFCNLSDLLDNLRTFNAPTHCVAMSPATGYTQSCQTNNIWLVGARNGRLFIPYFSWFEQRIINRSGCILAKRGEWNTFNSAVISHLVVGDTLIVQEREIDFQK